MDTLSLDLQAVTVGASEHVCSMYEWVIGGGQIPSVTNTNGEFCDIVLSL